MTCVESVDTRSKIEPHYVLAFSRRTPGISPALEKRVFFQLWPPKAHRLAPVRYVSGRQMIDNLTGGRRRLVAAG